MKTRLLCAIALLPLMLTACGGSAPTSDVQSSAPSPTVTQPPANGGSFGSVEELKDAYVAAGGSCAGWSQNNKVTLAAESGDCDSNTVLSIYLSKSEITQLVQNNKEINEKWKSDTKTVWLTGENWVINDADAAALKKKLGGTLVSF